MTEELKKQLIDGITKDAVAIYSEDSLKKRLQSGKKLVIKLGADPSRPDLHLGHTVVLRRLRMFQELGHEIVFVIGDFTGMIGDPTGRSKTRPSLTLEQTRLSGESYYKQVIKLLDPQKTRIEYNSKWLNALRFDEVIKLASKYTLARILERDDFSNRYANNLPISLHELLYPLVQGYDSVALGADVEVGGTDQTFNLLVGRSLQGDYGQTPQEVITYPLLVGLDGKEKMSKSLDNYIGIDEAPEVMFEKAMRVPDHLLPDYFRLTTDMPSEEAGALIVRDIRNAHFVYARLVVTRFHSAQAAQGAEERYRTVASGSLPAEVPELVIPVTELNGGEIKLITLLCRAGFAASNGEARRSIAGRAVRVDAQTVEDPNVMVNLLKPVMIRYGKNRFVKVSGEKA